MGMNWCFIRYAPGKRMKSDRPAIFDWQYNYTSYRLVPVQNKKYKYGCISANFCDQTWEFVSAWDIVHSEPIPDGMALFKHFINVCAHHGIDVDQLRKDLDYQVLTDSLITNEERHLANIGILRDAGTLRFQRMTPIFDSGNSMFFDSSPYSSREALLNIEINSFCTSELEMLSFVQNKDQIHLEQLPAPEDVTAAYDQIHPDQGSRNQALGKAYRMKARLLEEFLQGSLFGKAGNLLRHYSWMTED